MATHWQSSTHCRARSTARTRFRWSTSSNSCQPPHMPRFLRCADHRRVVRAVGEEDQPPVPIERSRIEREKRELALAHAAGNIADDEYLARMAELRRSAVPLREQSAVRPAEAVSYLRNLVLLWGSPGLTD